MRYVLVAVFVGALAPPAPAQWTSPHWTPEKCPLCIPVEKPAPQPFYTPERPREDFYRNYMRELKRKRELNDTEYNAQRRHDDNNAARNSNCLFGRGHINLCP